MLPTFETERLLVRPLATGDLDSLWHPIYADSEVARFFTSFASYEEVKQAHLRKVVLNADPANGGYGTWAVVRRTGGQVIGQLLLGSPEPMPWIVLPKSSPVYPLGEEVELGYAFGRTVWGHGYAAEACRALIEYAFGVLHLHRLVNSVLGANEASIGLMVRLGFRVEPNLHPGGDRVVGVLDSPLAGRRGAGRPG